MSDKDYELLLQAPGQWAPLGPWARQIDKVRQLQDVGLIKTRMMPDPSKEGFARMEWQMTRKGLQVRGNLEKG